MNMFVGIKIGDCLKEIKWKYYYRYKPIFDEDVEGKYTFIQRCLLFLKITKVNLFGDYLTPNLLKDKVEMNPGYFSLFSFLVKRILWSSDLVLLNSAHLNTDMQRSMVVESMA